MYSSVVDGNDRDRIVLASVVFTVLFSQLLLYPGVSTLVDALGADPDASAFAATPLEASMWFVVAEFVGYVAFVGVWGLASDVTGRRTPFIVASAIVGSVGYGALVVAPSLGSLPFEAILLLRVFQGSMTIGAFSLTMTMLMDLEGGHGRNMGAAGIAIGLGAALGAPIGGQLTAVDPLAPLSVAAVLLLCVGALVSVVPDRAPSDRRTPRAVIDGVRRTPALVIPFAFGLIDRLTAGFFALVGTLYFQETFDVDPATTGLLLACFFAPFALLQYPMGALSDRIGRVPPIVLGSICYGVGILAVSLAPTVATAAIAMVVVGVLGALISPATMALVTDLAADGERGIAMAGFNVAGSVGFLAGFLIGGSIASSVGYDLAFLVVGGLEVAIALVAIPFLLRLSIDRTTRFSLEVDADVEDGEP